MEVGRGVLVLVVGWCGVFKGFLEGRDVMKIVFVIDLFGLYGNFMYYDKFTKI